MTNISRLTDKGPLQSASELISYGVLSL